MNILILCDKFLPVSEHFIYNQIKCLNDHRLFLFTRKSMNRNLYDNEFLTEKKWYSNPVLRLRYKLKGKNNPYPKFIQNLLSRFIIKNKIDLIYIHYGTTATQYLDVLKELSMPVVCAFHGFDASRKLNHVNYKNAIVSLSNVFFKSTVPSDYLLNKLIDIGFPKNKILKIPYGADIDKIDQIEVKKANVNPDKLTIIHAGRLVAKKGVPDLVKSFIKVAETNSRIYLKIIGGGEEESLVKEIVEASDFRSRIELTGPLSHEKLIEEVKGADIFVLNSRETNNGETEGLPNSIMEAMACDTAVISTVHSGIPELITNGVNGLLVEPKNNIELEKAIAELISDQKLRNQFVKEGRGTVVSQFSIDHMKKIIVRMITSADT